MQIEIFPRQTRHRSFGCPSKMIYFTCKQKKTCTGAIVLLFPSTVSLRIYELSLVVYGPQKLKQNLLWQQNTKWHKIFYTGQCQVRDACALFPSNACGIAPNKFPPQQDVMKIDAVSCPVSSGRTNKSGLAASTLCTCGQQEEHGIFFLQFMMRQNAKFQHFETRTAHTQLHIPPVDRWCASRVWPCGCVPKYKI